VFCSKCGKKMADDSKFCPKCGTKVEDIEDSQFDDEDEDDENEDEDDEEFDEDDDEDDDRKPIEYFGLGTQYFDNGEYDNAIVSFSKAIRLGKRIGFNEKMLRQLGVNANEALAMIYLCRGFAYNQKLYWDNAKSDFTKVIQLAPDHSSEAYYERAELYRKEKKYDKAIDDCTRAIEINPKSYKAYSTRAFVYQSKGDRDNAIADYTKAIELSPKNVDNFADYYMRVQLYKNKGDYRRAFNEWNNMLGIFKPDPDGEDGRFLTIMAGLQECKDNM